MDPQFRNHQNLHSFYKIFGLFLIILYKTAHFYFLLFFVLKKNKQKYYINDKSFRGGYDGRTFEGYVG